MPRQSEDYWLVEPSEFLPRYPGCTEYPPNEFSLGGNDLLRRLDRDAGVEGRIARDVSQWIGWVELRLWPHSSS